MASLNATGHRHRASICMVSPRRTKGSNAKKIVSMAVVVHRYSSAHIAQWRGSRAMTETMVDATGRVLGPIDAIGHRWCRTFLV